MYELTRSAVALVGVDLHLVSRPNQATLGLLVFIGINAILNWRNAPTHEASVPAVALRLHRIAIGVICLFVLSELAGTIQDWVSAIDRKN